MEAGRRFIKIYNFLNTQVSLAPTHVEDMLSAGEWK